MEGGAGGFLVVSRDSIVLSLFCWLRNVGWKPGLLLPAFSDPAVACVEISFVLSLFLAGKMPKIE